MVESHPENLRHEFARKAVVALLVTSIVISVVALLFVLVRASEHGFDIASGILLATSLLFLLLALQAAIHLSTAPLRQKLITDTANAATSVSTSISQRLGLAKDSDREVSTVGIAAGTFAQWVIFFATRGSFGALLATGASGLIGVATVAVAYQQAKLLENQTTIMEKQTQVMAAENNGRTLEFLLTSVVADIRSLRANPSTSEFSWMTLIQRVNVISKALDPVDSRAGIAANFSRDRGILLATLIAEKFEMDKRFSPILVITNADLSMLPFAPMDGSRIKLGRADLSGAYARDVNFQNYDLSGVKFRGAYLPPASAFRFALFSNKLQPTELNGTFLDNCPQGAFADLEGAHVPDENWIRELGDQGVSRDWKITQGAEGAFVLARIDGLQTPVCD